LNRGGGSVDSGGSAGGGGCAKGAAGDVAQAAVQVTPLLLLVVAVMLAVAPVASDAGALTETVTAGGVFELPPPQAVRKSVIAPVTERERLRRKFIAYLRAGPEDALR
jgi:hypothetical protein